MTLLSLYEKLEKLIQRLPEPLQSPILREIRPLQSLFLLQRPPRLLLLGDRRASRSELVNALMGSAAAAASEDLIQDGSWQLFTRRPGKGKLRLLDARRPASLSLLHRALNAPAPDLCLYAFQSAQSPEETAADLEQAGAVMRALEELHRDLKLYVVGVAPASATECAPEEVRRQLDAAMHGGGNMVFARRVAGLSVLAAGADERQRLAVTIAGELPFESKLEWVRMAGLRKEQAELAHLVVRSVTAICAAVGAQPIPLADFPILTSLQAAMVAGIMHISGREMKMSLAVEWLTALGANIGMGLALREGARAALKLLPVWGGLLSGGIAAAGTFAIGRAAIAYFIEGVSLPSAQKLFHDRRHDKKLIAALSAEAPEAELASVPGDERAANGK